MTHTTQHTLTPVRTWLTMPEAAAMLGISVRTLERHIAKGTYTMTHAPDGRRMVDMTDAAPAQAALVHEARSAGDDARRQSAVLSQAVERMAAVHEHQIMRLQADVDTAQAELASTRKTLTGMQRRLNTRTWVAGVAACVVAGLGATLTHTLQDAEKQGATLRQMSDTLTQQTARAEAAERLAVAAEASEAATRRVSMTHTQPWWASTAQSESRAP